MYGSIRDHGNGGSVISSVDVDEKLLYSRYNLLVSIFKKFFGLEKDDLSLSLLLLSLRLSATSFGSSRLWSVRLIENKFIDVDNELNGKITLVGIVPGNGILNNG